MRIVESGIQTPLRIKSVINSQLCVLLRIVVGLVNAKNGNSYSNATLLNMTVDYAATNCITLWAKGDNLLAQRYEINKGYVMPRATFMAGVKVKL